MDTASNYLSFGDSFNLLEGSNPAVWSVNRLERLKTAELLASKHINTFNSMSSYYRVFKQVTGLSPKEYIQEYLKDLESNV